MRAIFSISITLSLASLLVPTLARQTPTSYCKCICFQNSTIIPLNSPPEQKPPPANDPPADSSDSNRRAVSSYGLPDESIDPFHPLAEPQLTRRDEGDGTDEDPGNQHHRTLTCSDCNRAFCLDYNLPICKGAKEEDVFTSCFQRDSVKDETVVLLFILLTASLLSWAVMKPWVDKFRGLSSGSGSILGSAQTALGGNGTTARGHQRGPSSSLLPRTQGSYRDENANARDRGDSGSIARQGGLNS